VGKFATGYVPAKILQYGVEPEKRAVVTFDGNDLEEKVVAIRED
jgi:hypothetical protein